MKLHFESNLDYQLAAIESVCDLFRGQETCRTEFTVTREFGRGQAALAGLENDLGIGNRLTLLDDEILANLNDVQLRNGLRPSESLESGDFTVEMETGTGKTYVYLRTIFELNRRFGFNKFVIVVPSVAIKEGVYKTLDSAGQIQPRLGDPCRERRGRAALFRGRDQEQSLYGRLARSGRGQNEVWRRALQGAGGGR